MKLQGSIVALITPFYEDGTVNFERLGEILDWHIAQGTDGILVLGTTGESSTMSHEEDDAVCRFTIEPGSRPRLRHRGQRVQLHGNPAGEKQKICGHGGRCPFAHYSLLHQGQCRRHVPSLCRCGRRSRCTGDFRIMFRGAPVVPFRWRRWLVWPGIPIYAASKKQAAIFLTR